MRAAYGLRRVPTAIGLMLTYSLEFFLSGARVLRNPSESRGMRL